MMMSTLDKAILDSAIEENFNENHMGLQGEKWHWKNQTIQEQRSILRSIKIDSSVQKGQKFQIKATRRISGE